jgi:hypothetical protein
VVLLLDTDIAQCLDCVESGYTSPQDIGDHTGFADGFSRPLDDDLFELVFIEQLLSVRYILGRASVTLSAHSDLVLRQTLFGLLEDLVLVLGLHD